MIGFIERAIRRIDTATSEALPAVARSIIGQRDLRGLTPRVIDDIDFRIRDAVEVMEWTRMKGATSKKYPSLNRKTASAVRKLISHSTS